MSDLVEHLQAGGPTERSAADEIVRLRAVNAELVAALKDTLRIADAATLHSGGEHNRKRIAAARAALAKATGA